MWDSIASYSTDQAKSLIKALADLKQKHGG
jgi:hypothetical protein